MGRRGGAVPEPRWEGDLYSSTGTSSRDQQRRMEKTHGPSAVCGRYPGVEKRGVIYGSERNPWACRSSPGHSWPSRRHPATPDMTARALHPFHLGRPLSSAGDRVPARRRSSSRTGFDGGETVDWPGWPRSGCTPRSSPGPRQSSASAGGSSRCAGDGTRPGPPPPRAPHVPAGLERVGRRPGTLEEW